MRRYKGVALLLRQQAGTGQIDISTGQKRSSVFGGVRVRGRYKATLSTGDVLNISRLHLGSKRHCQILDLIKAIRTEEEEDLVRLVIYGWPQEAIAAEYGVTQPAIHYRLQTILRRAT